MNMNVNLVELVGFLVALVSENNGDERETQIAMFSDWLAEHNLPLLASRYASTSHCWRSHNRLRLEEYWGGTPESGYSDPARVAVTPDKWRGGTVAIRLRTAVLPREWLATTMFGNGPGIEEFVFAFYLPFGGWELPPRSWQVDRDIEEEVSQLEAILRL